MGKFRIEQYVKKNWKLFFIFLYIGYLLTFINFFIYIRLSYKSYKDKKIKDDKILLFFFRATTNFLNGIFYCPFLEANLIVIFHNILSPFFNEHIKKYSDAHIIYIIMGSFSILYLFFICLNYTNFRFSKEEECSITIGRFVIINSFRLFLLIKTFFLFIIYISSAIDIKIFFYVFICFLSAIYFYSNYLEYSYQYGQNIIRKLYLFFGAVYLLISMFLIFGYFIRRSSFKGLIDILFVFAFLSFIIIFSFPSKEMKINLENYSFKNEYEVYNQLILMIISVQKKKNDRKYLLDLAAYWYKSNDKNINVNEFIYSSLDNTHLELFIYKYIDKTYKTMIHRFNNSILLTISYASFLYEILNKYSKAYIILYDLFYTNHNLTFSQSFYIYKIEKELQEKAFEIGFDKTDISFKYQCNKLIDLISQISDIYITFWSLLLNSQEHQDINRLRDIGNKINTINEKIEEKYEEIKKIKIKDKSIFTLYRFYKRDILNEINEEYSNEDILNMEEYFNQNKISLCDLNSFVSSSDFQFVICSGKEDNFGIILKISQEMCSYFGYTDVEVIGQHLNIFLPDFMRKKHDELLEDRISKIKLEDKISNSLKRHVIYFKTSSKYIYPIPLDVCTIFDEDGKATIFGKIDYDNINIFYREISAICHIMTNENLIIQTFSRNCLHLLELSNSCMNGSVEITKYIKEFYSEFFNRITSFHYNISKKIDKQKLKISILREKYFTSMPEELVTFDQKIFKMNVEEIKLNGFIVGYLFHFVYQLYDNSSLISKRTLKNLNNSKTVSPKRNLISPKLTRKSITQNIQEHSFDINSNYLPQVEKIYFDFENKAYQFDNKNLITISQYYNKEIAKKNENRNLNNNSSSMTSSNYSENEESKSNSFSDSSFSYESSSFSSDKNKNEHVLFKSNTVNKFSNFVDEFHRVNLTSISLLCYDFKKKIFVNIPKKTNSCKIDDLINREKTITKKVSTIENEKKEIKKKNETYEKDNIKNIPSFKKRKKDEVQNLKKYYTSKCNNSVKFALIFILFHIFVVAISGFLFFSICFSVRRLMINNIEFTRYLIKFGENSHSTLTYSFQLALLRNPNYTNFFSQRDRIIEVMRKNLIKKYQDCLILLSSFQLNSISLSKKTSKKMQKVEIYYFIIDDSLNISQISSNMKTMISQYAYSIYNFANANIENIHFFNKDYNFIMLNTNDFFVEKIKQYILIMFDEYNYNLHSLEKKLWILGGISLFFLFFSLLVGIKIVVSITAEREKLLRYFFRIEPDFIKNAITKCQKFIDLNKNNSFDSKYLISKPKIKIEEDVDINDDEIEFSNTLNFDYENPNNNQSISNKNKTFILKKGQLISDKQSIKENAIIYIFYIGTIVSFILLVMIHNGKKYRDIKKLLNIYYTTVTHKSIFILSYNYIRIFILYSCSSISLINFDINNLDYIYRLYKEHQHYQSLFESNLTYYSLPHNSSYYYNIIIKGPLYSYFENFASKYNISCVDLSSNIAYYGINPLMIYYIGTLFDLCQKIEIFIQRSKTTGFVYNDLSYGSSYYTNDFNSRNESEIENYNKNNPFQLFNDYQLVELNVLNEEIYRPAIETFIEALSKDIDHYGNLIHNYIQQFTILFFVIIISFNCFFYIPYILHKNKNINKVRQMLMIIPKDILLKIIEKTNGKREVEELQL